MPEVVVVLSEWYREWRYNRGFSDGRAEGAEQAHQMWQDWLRRKETAEAEGREFDEPPPKPELPTEKN